MGYIIIPSVGVATISVFSFFMLTTMAGVLFYYGGRAKKELVVGKISHERVIEKIKITQIQIKELEALAKRTKKLQLQGLTSEKTSFSEIEKQTERSIASRNRIIFQLETALRFSIEIAKT